MKKTRPISKRLLSIVLCLVLMMTYAPLSALAADGSSAPYFNRVVDESTMDNWEKYFLETNDTSNAGGVWTDKSVFTDASEFNGLVTMQDDSRNFLTALSAIAANKEIVGYSTVPTDTVLVLDLSGSMNTSNSEDDLIDAANDAIDRLLAVNNNNRVGVVLYSGSSSDRTYDDAVTRLLPIDRYTTRDGVYLRLSNNNVVSVDDNVQGTVANTNLNNRKSFTGATYIQAGLWEAMKMFKEMDTVIGENNWQSGDNRMPILVLMSDGAPTLNTSFYDDVENSSYTTGNGWLQQTHMGANLGGGNEDGIGAGDAFLTQLTASYVINQIKDHYQQKNASTRGLFYTLGFNIGNNSIAQSVMNPDNSTLTDSLWNTYSDLTSGTMPVDVRGRSNATTIAINRNSYVTNKSYVDQYFSASGDGLSNAFSSIVEEIILQSRYYPTHLEGGSPDFSGYVEFEDTLGEYMEVKHINGILLGDTLFDGHMMASKIADNSGDGLGTVENPTALGDEFIRAVKTRLGIASTADAQMLVANAFAAGQLKYNSATDWSNYIGWYAKADGTYAGFWDEASTAAAPAGAVYKIKSYGFLGETTGSIKNSDMMYMSVQVRTDIATGQQTMLWKIPAALVPMVTYLVTLKGTNVDVAEDVKVTIENEGAVSPIRLIFESGLRSDLNELNITRITDGEHIAEDGVTRQFWTNYFDISAQSHDEHVTTMAEFTPSLENERFYYTEASAVHKQIAGADTETTADDRYALVGENETLDENGTYFHRRYVFVKGNSEPQFFYEKMSKASIQVAKKNGWDSTFKTKDNTYGAWVVPAGTPARELQMYDQQKKENLTDSANMVFHPYLTEQNDIFYVDMNLGNNGRLEVTPAQGLKLSKTVDVYEPGTSTEFRFRITVTNANGTPYTGVVNSWITDLDVVPLGAPTEITLPASGIYTVELSRNQTLWLTGIPTGATYTIEEISTNDDYKVKSVHVNGVSTGTVASGRVAAYFIDDVDFVNTALGEGDLVITKQVVDENGRTVDIKDDVRFTAQVTLTDANNNPLSGTFAASNTAGSITLVNGTFTVALAEGESFVIRNIPEETRYTVTETNVPAGFALNTERSQLTGTVDASGNDQALIVNTYDPIGINGQNVTVEVTKTISGNRTTWMPGESYTFEVRRGSTVLNAFTIRDNNAHKLTLSMENYNEAGTYRYSIVETVGTQGGITYDTVERRFAVVVADADMDGDLEITAVNNEAYTTVTQLGNAYTVSANFNNKYAPTGSASVTIDIQKKMNGDYRLNGFQFALYDDNDMANANEFTRSTVTDIEGKAHITLTYAPNRATMEGVTYTYYLAEINTGNPNITYDDTVYKVDITVKDNGDGTISASSVISGIAQGEEKPTFTNTYTPSASAYVTLTANKEIVGDRVLNANEFDFVIEALTPGAPMPASTTVKNDANGSVMFDAIEFKTVGTYKYKIYESDANKIGGFTYDGKFYEVTVTVTDSNAILSAAVTRVVKENENDTGRELGANELITFTNAYDATDAKAIISGEKILTGKTLLDGDFTFVLTPTGSTTLPVGYDNTATNVGRTITFKELVFDKVGVYTYTVTEQGVDNANFDYDESVYAITITVTDNGRGVLSADVRMTKNGIPSTGIVFRNGFVPTPIPFDISAEFGGIKNLDGRPLEVGEFEFELINAINGQKIGESVKNDADGNFAFPAVTLPEAGIYHFKVTEVVGDEKGVTYDTSSYHVRLEVVQDDAGKLHVNDQRLYKGTVTKQEVGGVLTEVVSYDNITTNGEIAFANSYKADPTQVIVAGTKTLTGRELKADEFSFVLYDQAGEELDTVTNAADGSFAFAPIPVTDAGEYVYTVKEITGSEEGITYDTAVYTVTVTVSDNLDGTFKVEYAYAKDDAEAEALTFANIYTPKEEIPSTGDHSPYLWVAVLFVSGGLMGATIYGKKRKEAEEN